jgi:hypothetical protein
MLFVGVTLIIAFVSVFFTFEWECEHCGHAIVGGLYDLVTQMRCPHCRRWYPLW